MVGGVLVPLLVQGVFNVKREEELFAGCAFSDGRDYLNPVNFFARE